MIDVSTINADDFKSWFVRDFKYYIAEGKTAPSGLYDACDSVTDLDISKAFTEATINFNPGLFSDDASATMCFLYLAAFYLVNDLQTSSAGMGSSGLFPVNSRSIGGVSESYTIPEWMTKDPILSNFATNRYGQKYLSMIKPLLIGRATVYRGATTPF